MSDNVRIMFIHGLDISLAFESCIGLPVAHHGLYVVCEGLPVMHEESACHTA